jgi:predicted phage terminase large subunit-like protein
LEASGETNPRDAQCTFHPAKLTDNPHLDTDAYRASLARLDPITRAQLEDGNWEIHQTGRMFQADWFATIAASAVPERCDTIRFWDLAATAKTPDNDPDYTAGALVSYDHRTKTYYVRDIQRRRDTSGRIERHVRHIAERDGKSTAIYIEQEPGSAGKTVIDHYRTNVLNGWPVRGERPTGDKIVRAEPFSARAEHGEVKLVHGSWNHAFLDEIILFPDGRHDDQVDAVSGAMTVLARRPHYSNITIPVDELSRENTWNIF